MADAGLLDDTQSEETTFIPDDISAIIKEARAPSLPTAHAPWLANYRATEQVLNNTTYVHTKVPNWTSMVIEGTLKRLKELNKPFKYIVTAVIMQKNGAGLHTATSCHWDNSCDGNATLRWENKSMYCLVTVFGLAI